MSTKEATPGLLVNIDVPDLTTARAFYVDGLGLQVARKLGTGALELRAGDLRVYLLEQPEGSKPFDGAQATRDYRRHWCPVHLDFVVTDLESGLQRAVSAGARSEGPVREASWGRLALLSDPFGNGFCLLEFSAEGYDAIATE